MDIAEIHGYVIGVTIIASWLLVMVLALGLRLAVRVRAGRLLRTDPEANVDDLLTRADLDAPWFWRVVSVAQLLLGLQVVVGVVMLLMGRVPAAGDLFTTVFHFLYGLVFPVIVLFFGHRAARTRQVHPFTAFALVGLVIFGLTLRGFTAVLMARGRL